MNALMLESGL